MSVQTTYSFRSATIGQAGQVDDTSLINVDSFAAEAEILFGKPLKRGTVPGTQALTWAENDATVPVIGISVFAYNAVSPTTGVQLNKYSIGDTVGVISTGRVLVVAAVNVTAGQDAYVIVDDDATAGTFTNVALNNVKVGKFLSTATATTLTQLELNL